MSGIQKVQQQTQQKKVNKVQEKPEKRNRQMAAPERLMQDPNSLSSEEMLSAQKQVGNQTVQRALDKNLAREASTDQNGNLIPEISSEIQNARGSGQKLPADVQKEVSGSFKKDFSGVRIHTDEKADRLSRTINARAFTIGSDIFFKKGVFAPSSSKGRDTLFHELTHVVQQSGGKSSGGQLKLGAVGSAHEQEAESTAKRLVSKSQGGTTLGGATVQKQGEEEVNMQGGDDGILASGDMVDMQGEEEELAMQGEEEELAMQGEEEVDMQPAGGVVQRGITDWFKKKLSKNKIPEAPDPSGLKISNPAPAPKSSGSLKRNLSEGFMEHNVRGARRLMKGEADPLAKVDKETGEKSLDQAKKGFMEDSAKFAKAKTAFKSKDLPKQLSLGKAKLRHVPDSEKPTDKGLESAKQELGSPEKREEAKVNRREHLLEIIKNPESKPKEVEDAETELKSFHKRKLHSNYSKDAISERMKNLKEKAQAGNKAAGKEYQNLKDSHPSKGAKFKSFLGKAGSWAKTNILPELKPMLGSMLGMGGKKKEESEGGDEKGGGGSGVAGLIGKLYSENEALKKELAKYKKGNKPEAATTTD